MSRARHKPSNLLKPPKPPRAPAALKLLKGFPGMKPMKPFPAPRSTPPTGPTDPAILEHLRDAIDRRLQVTATYVDEDGKRKSFTAHETISL